MARIVASDVQEWLEGSKFTLTELDAGYEAYFSEKVLGRLRGRYDVTTWLDESTTPEVVKQVIAQLVAAAEYRKRYSEDLEDGIGLNWAQWLESSAEVYLVDLLDGTIVLEEATITDTGLGRPAFYPNDLSSVLDPAMFSMTKEF